MKKLIAIIVILLTNIVIFSACASHDSHAYTWIKTQDGHFKEYYCNCETNESFELHCDNNNDFICDVCKFALPNEVTPDSSSSDSSTAPDSSSLESSTSSSVDSSSTSDSSVLDSSLDSSTTPDSSSSDSSTAPDSSSLDSSTTPDSSTDSSTTPDEPVIPDNPNEPHTHNYSAKVTAPTCESAGYTTYTCSCGDNYLSNYVSATGHSYTTKVTAPTCETGGYTTYSCACGYNYIGNQVAETGHSYKGVITSPTCTTAGYTTYTCANCGDYYTGNQVSATGHSWQAATTTTPKTCTVCGLTEGSALGSGSGSSSSVYDTLYVHYIDVGQGDSIFIQVGDCDILIDAGKSGQGSTVVNYLKSKGVDDIELMINSHPDNDHYGGLPTVLSNFVVERAWISPFNKTTSTYVSFKNNIASEGITAETPSVGTVFRYEYLSLTVLYSTAASNSNNSSLVIMLEYGSFKFLFTGDISSSVENSIASSKDVSCDVLKVAHHGSAGSSSSSFLSKTGAKYGVICVGSENTYGHPTSTALNNLANAGISVHRTDTDGTAVFSTNGSTLTAPNGSTSGGSSSGGSSSGGSSSGGSSSSGSSSSDLSSATFIGNSSTKTVHIASCGHKPTTNAVDLSSYAYSTIIGSLGYKACSYCLSSFIGNSSTKVFHISTCGHKPTKNAITLSYSYSYIVNTLGYKPCSFCLA